MSIILKEIRKTHNLTQSELAKKLEVSRSAIAQIESGKNNISLDLGKKIASVFAVPITKVLNADEKIAWDLLEQTGGDYWHSFYGETSIMNQKFDEIEYIKLLISKIAEEKKLNTVIERFDKFCKEYDFYNFKKDFLENNHKYYDNKKLEETFRILNLGLIEIKDDLCFMLIFEYDILKEYYEPQYKKK